MIQPIPNGQGESCSNDRSPDQLDPVAIRTAISKAFYEARRRHKLLGQPIVEWRDGKVALVPAEEIELVEPTDAGTTSDKQRTP